MPIEHLTSALEEHAKRGTAYATYRAYYAGQHELQFATPDFQAKYGKLFESLRQNLCPAVVTATTDRLRIRTWGGATEDRLADENGLSRLVAAVNIETARCGDAYTLTWLGRTGQPKARYHRAPTSTPSPPTGSTAPPKSGSRTATVVPTSTTQTVSSVTAPSATSARPTCPSTTLHGDPMPTTTAGTSSPTASASSRAAGSSVAQRNPSSTEPPYSPT